MSPSNLHRFRPAALLLWCAALLSACGGAGEMGSGGTGAAASAEGTVTGFGSIFVDGKRFEDSNAAIKIDSLTATPDDGETKLGQRVEVAYAVDGVAQTVKIEPEVMGVVTAKTASEFTVLEQTIVVNTDPAAGPVTQFDGYTGLADVRVTDLVEVHGVARSAAPGSVIQATRVEKRTVALPYLRVVGTVAGLAAGPKFMLGALAIDGRNAVLVPAGKVLADGQSVVVFAATDALTTVGLQPTLTATRIRIRERTNGAMPTYLGGVISNRTADTFNIGEVRVRVSTATTIDPPRVLADGQYVQVQGEFNPAGELVATQVKVRSNVLDADLRGTAIGYVDATKTFTVRGVSVTISPVASVDCPNADLSGQYVEVSGHIRLGGVDATSVKCKSAPDGAVIERRGTSSSVSTADNTFTLATASGVVTVRWTVLTYFSDNLRRTQPSLNNQALRVEGVLLNNVLVATKIRLDR